MERKLEYFVLVPHISLSVRYGGTPGGTAVLHLVHALRYFSQAFRDRQDEIDNYILRLGMKRMKPR